MDGLDEVYRLQRFLPPDQEAVGHFLRCLLTGETLNGAEKLIHHANIYACEPKDLAARYPPVPTAVSTGDRFFFTTCKPKNAKNKKGPCERRAGAGTWTVQTTEDVRGDKGVKIGEARNVSFKKNKKSTGWVMEEYRSLLPQAMVANGEKVLCQVHLAQNAPAAARQESNAYKKRPTPAPAPQPAEPVMASAHAQKRPSPVAAADMSSCKKMRIAAPVPVPEPEVEYDDCPMWFTPAAPVSTLPAASTEAPEADDDMGCSWEELFGEEQQEEQTIPVEHQVLDQGMEQLAAPIYWESDVPEEEHLVSDQEMDQFVQICFADESEVQQEEQQTTRPIEAQNKIQQLASDEQHHSDETSIDWETDVREEEQTLAEFVQHSEAPINWEQFFSDEEDQLVASCLAEHSEEQVAAPIDWESEQILAENKIQQLLSAQVVDLDQLEAAVGWEALLPHLHEAELKKIQQLASDELRHSDETSIDWESFWAESIDVGQLLDDLHEVEAEFQKKSCYQYSSTASSRLHLSTRSHVEICFRV